MTDLLQICNREPDRLIIAAGGKAASWPFKGADIPKSEGYTFWPLSLASEGWLYVLTVGDLAMRSGNDIVVLHGVEAQWGRA